MLSITTARVSVLRGASFFVVNRSKKSVNRPRFGAKPSIRLRATSDDDDDAKKREEEEEWKMGSDAKSNVVPRAPKLPVNAPDYIQDYMHGVLAFNRFYPENARGDAFNRHLVVALVSVFEIRARAYFFVSLSFSRKSILYACLRSSAMMRKNAFLEFLILCYDYKYKTPVVL